MKYHAGNYGNVDQLQPKYALPGTLLDALANSSNIQNVLSMHTPDATLSCVVAGRTLYTTNSGVMSVELSDTLALWIVVANPSISGYIWRLEVDKFGDTYADFLSPTTQHLCICCICHDGLVHYAQNCL